MVFKTLEGRQWRMVISERQNVSPTLAYLPVFLEFLGYGSESGEENGGRFHGLPELRTQMWENGRAETALVFQDQVAKMREWYTERAQKIYRKSSARHQLSTDQLLCVKKLRPGKETQEKIKKNNTWRFHYDSCSYQSENSW